MDFDGTAVFGNLRSKRYAIVIEDGKVKTIHVEPDGTGLNRESSDVQEHPRADLLPSHRSRKGLGLGCNPQHPVQPQR